MPVKECCAIDAHTPLAARVPQDAVLQDRPEPKKLGLLDAGDGWLRQKFGELGVLEYETWEDTGAEYERMQLDQTAG